MRLTKNLLLCVVIIILCLSCVSGGATVFAETGRSAGTSKVVFWHLWGAGYDNDVAFNAVARAHEERNPGVEVEVVPGKNLEKLTLAVAGGVAPDAAIVDERIPSYVISGVIQDITDLVERDNISAEDFVAPSWREVLWQNRIYAIPYHADPNFALFRNNQILAEAGCDTETAPRTLPELDAINRKITQVDVDGKVKQVGIVPWSVYGWSNSMYTWGWAFGGKFYDYEKQSVTADHPLNVKALEWMKSYVDRYTWAGMDGLSFMNRNVAFQPYGPWELPHVQAAQFDYAISMMPYHPDGGEQNPTWVGGHKIVIPQGAKNRQEGWNFIKFLGADPEGTAIEAGPYKAFPAYIRSDVYDFYREEEYMSIFADILMTASHQRPVIPVAETYWQELEKAVVSVLQEGKPPLQALQQVDEVVQSKLDETMAGLQ